MGDLLALCVCELIERFVFALKRLYHHLCEVNFRAFDSLAQQNGMERSGKEFVEFCVHNCSPC